MPRLAILDVSLDRSLPRVMNNAVSGQEPVAKDISFAGLAKDLGRDPTRREWNDHFESNMAQIRQGTIAALPANAPTAQLKSKSVPPSGLALPAAQSWRGNNDKGLQAKADLAERARQAAAQKVQEATSFSAGNGGVAGVCKPTNPLGLSDQQLQAQAATYARLGLRPPATGPVGSAEWFKTASEAELHRNGYQTVKARDPASGLTAAQKLEMALVLPPLAAVSLVSTGGLVGSLGSRWVASQLALQPATRIGVTEVAKGMAVSGGVSTGIYTSFQQENSTPAGVAVAFGSGAIGAGLVKQGLNYLAVLPNTAVPFTYSNAVTHATGTAFGFGTIGWMNGPPGLSDYGAVSRSGESWWTTPIFAPPSKP